MMPKLPTRLATRTDDTAAPMAWLIVVAAMLAETSTPVLQTVAVSRLCLEAWGPWAHGEGSGGGEDQDARL